jgi:hypothetical protein
VSEKLKLATIGNGLAEIPLDTETIKREMNPHPNTESSALGNQFRDNVWYRRPDLSLKCSGTGSHGFWMHSVELPNWRQANPAGFVDSRKTPYLTAASRWSAC